jgi:ActR/RegA family two-component response regulator
VERKIIDRRQYSDAWGHTDIHRKETLTVTTLCYKVTDLSLHDDAGLAAMEDVLNRQGLRDGNWWTRAW